MQSRSKAAAGAAGAGAGAWQEQKRGLRRPGGGHEHGRSGARAFYLFLANVGPHAMFHGQEQSRTRAGAG